MGAELIDTIEQAKDEVRIDKYPFGCVVMFRPYGQCESRQMGVFNRLGDAQKFARTLRAQRAAWLATEDKDAENRAGYLATTIGLSLRDCVAEAIEAAAMRTGGHKS